MTSYTFGGYVLSFILMLVWFAVDGCFDCLCRCCAVVWLGLMWLCLCLLCVVICYAECWFGNCLWFLLRV